MMPDFTVAQRAISGDSLRAVLDSVFAGSAYDWREQIDPVRWLWYGWNALADWLSALREGNPVLYQWFLFALVAILVLIVVHAAWTLARTFRTGQLVRDSRERTPAPEPRDAAWYARQADRYAGERRFAEAIQAAWHALVLELDTRGLVRYRSAKTPGEYAGERTLTPADRERLSGLVVDLYRFVFGREPCTEREYHAWRSLAAGDWHAAST
jgi:hypothetical protein